MEPIRLEVVLTPSDEVVSLRNQVAELTKALEELQMKYNRVEYLYRCESIINQELIDLCREHRVPYRPALEHFREG